MHEGEEISRRDSQAPVTIDPKLLELASKSLIEAGKAFFRYQEERERTKQVGAQHQAQVEQSRKSRRGRPSGRPANNIRAGLKTGP